MNKLITVFLFELRSTLRRRSYQIATAGFPIIGIGVLLIVRLVTGLAEGGEPELRGYVDRWGRLPAQLPVDTMLVSYSNQEDARTALLAGEIEAYFVIPPNYVETGLIQEYATSESSVLRDVAAPAFLHNVLVQALVADAVAPEVAARLERPIRIERVRLTPEGEVAPEERNRFARFIVPYVFGLLLIMAIVMTSNLLVQSVAEEKQTRTIEILLSSVSSSILMAGKVLGLGVAARMAATSPEPSDLVAKVVGGCLDAVKVLTGAIVGFLGGKIRTDG